MPEHDGNSIRKRKYSKAPRLGILLGLLELATPFMA